MNVTLDEIPIGPVAPNAAASDGIQFHGRSGAEAGRLEAEVEPSNPCVEADGAQLSRRHADSPKNDSRRPMAILLTQLSKRTPS